MLKQWSSVTEAVTIFLYATLAIEGNTPHHQIVSTKHMCVCVKQTGKVFTVSMAFSAKKLPLYPNWWSYHRFTKACWHSRLLHSFPASVSGSCVCAQGINIQEMAACLCVGLCRDVHSQLRWGRLLQESAVRPEPRGVLVRGPARWRDDGHQNPWQPQLW